MKGGNSDLNNNTSNMNTDTNQAAIVEFHTSQPDDNIIPVQVKITRTGRKRGVNEFPLTIMSQLLDQEV